MTPLAALALLAALIVLILDAYHRYKRKKKSDVTRQLRAHISWMPPDLEESWVERESRRR